MEILTTLQNGNKQTAYVSLEEFENLDFKHYEKAPEIKETDKYTLDKIKVFFNQSGQVVDYKIYHKVKERIVDVAGMFSDIEEAVENKGLDREKAYATAFDKLGVNRIRTNS